MKIDVEQFLALAVALGAVGAVGVAVYTSSSDVDPITLPVAHDTATNSDDSEPAEQLAAAMMPSPVVAAPTDLDEASGIPPVVPEPESNGTYAPGPDTESASW